MGFNQNYKSLQRNVQNTGLSSLPDKNIFNSEETIKSVSLFLKIIALSLTRGLNPNSLNPNSLNPNSLNPNSLNSYSLS